MCICVLPYCDKCPWPRLARKSLNKLRICLINSAKIYMFAWKKAFSVERSGVEPYNLVSRVGCVITGNCLHLRTCCQMVMAPREVAMTVMISIIFALCLAPSVNYHLKCYALIKQTKE